MDHYDEFAYINGIIMKKIKKSSHRNDMRWTFFAFYILNLDRFYMVVVKANRSYIVKFDE